MKKTISLSVLIIISLFALITMGFRAVVAQDRHLYIKPDGSVAYGYVDHATPPVKREGDLYTLTAGTGNIVIQRSNIVLDGDGYDVMGGALKLAINVSNVMNVTIRNIQFKMADIGIYFENSSINRVLNNTFSSYANYYPYYLLQGITINDSSHDNLVENNSFLNTDVGIHLLGNCHNATISENSFCDSRSAIYAESNCNYTCIANNNLTTMDGYGIELLDSSNCQVSSNYMKCNGTGIVVDHSNYLHLSENTFEICGLEVLESYGNTVINNTVNGKPLMYLEDVSDYSVEDAGQVVLVDCRNVTVDNLNLSNSTIGIELWNTNNSRLANNSIIGNNWVGVFLDCSVNNTVTGNDVEENCYGGIHLENSAGNCIIDNLIRANIDGVSLSQSSYNYIYHNNIINNVYPIALWDSNNSFDNGYPSGGNYWGSNYSGTDLHKGLFQNETGSDGIGDIVYAIGENQDNYPLMNPWHEPPWTPYAFFNYSPIQPRINDTVTFDAWSSYDFDGKIVTYLWDFGDGTVANETNPITSHAYIFPEFYNVTLTVVDNEGLSNTTQGNIGIIKINSNLSISTDLSTLILGQNTQLSGSIDPKRAQANITIWSKSQSHNAWEILANVTTDEYGNYSYNWTPSGIGTHIVKANFTGDEYTFSSETGSLAVTCVRIPTSISIFTNCSTTLNGFKVGVKGVLLDMYGAGLKNGIIVLSYTFGGIGTWTPITSDTTNSMGEYNVVWFPSATGYFLLKAEWSGDASHLGTFDTITVGTVPYENQYVFSVESNSTISDLSFDTTSRRLTFTASGENGTTGYTRVTIAKNLNPDVASLKVHVDGVEYTYTVTETNDSWVLFFTYDHSSHLVEIELKSTSLDLLPFLLPPLLVIAALVAVVLVRRQHSNAHNIPKKEANR